MLRLEDLPDEECRHCGKPLDGLDVRAKYCSQRCRIDRYNAEMTAIISEERRAARAGRTCKQCGRRFDAARRDQVYCRKQCRALAGYYASKARIRREAVE